MVGAVVQDDQRAAGGLGSKACPLGNVTVTDPAEAAATVALERLAATLDRAEFITTIVISTGRRTRLTVISRHTKAAEDIYANGWFWWSWAERIAPVDDVLTAARRVTSLLRTTWAARP
jgi:hypothetical protein